MKPPVFESDLFTFNSHEWKIICAFFAEAEQLFFVHWELLQTFLCRFGAALEVAT